MVRTDLEEASSLLRWLPAARAVGVLMPETHVVEVDRGILQGMLDGRPLPGAIRAALFAAADTLGYPLFLRTDQCAGKHEWRRTCFVPDRDSLLPHLAAVVEENETAGPFGLPYRAVVLREYVPPAAVFCSVRGLPVGHERRYFVRDGQVVCHHPYWAEAALEGWHGLPEDWRVRLAEANTETPAEVELLKRWAKRLAGRLCQDPGGAWSLDFMLGADGGWWFIDAARAEVSWHPTCPDWPTEGVGG